MYCLDYQKKVYLFGGVGVLEWVFSNRITEYK